MTFGVPLYASIELSDIEAGTGGFAINGVSAGDESGRSVSNAGDVNGDGLDDLIVGANGDDPNGDGSGASYVVFGKSGGTTVELSDVEAGTGGFVINGGSAGDQSGFSVSNAGDINGDGLSDLIVGAPGDDPNGNGSGAAFVVFGKSSGTAVELSDVEAGTGGFVINGVSAGDQSGYSVSNAGDVNGDGLEDLIVGAPGDDPNGNGSGASYVVFGKSGSTTVELSDIEAGTGGFVINGFSAGDKSGVSVSNAGDVNGDGLDDLVVAAPWARHSGKDWIGRFITGEHYVVFGKSADTTAVELSTLEADSGGFAMTSSTSYSIGQSVSNAGDINGDGLDDIIFGSPLWAVPYDFYGGSFVVFGKTDSAAVSQAGLRSSIGGFDIDGFDLYSGTSVSSAGDINGDGLDDFFVGANRKGIVVFGNTAGSTLTLAINAYQHASFESASSAGDVNGDGLDDLIIGARFNDPNGTSSGASFVVFGVSPFGTIVLAGATGIGTSGNDNLLGNDLDNVIYGLSGDDILDGGDGGDTLIGGGGVDTYVGGTGIDRVQYQDITAGLRADLQMPSTNTGAAAGETYQSIEDLLGSQGDDTILGDNNANTLFGYYGNDTIWGRNGNDSLRGGDGDDNLIGGRDVDTYVGGNGTDRVQYQDFAAGLRVDLLSPYTNTGAAAGETFISIEDLLGSHGDDFVLGDHNANKLLGYHGNDTIYGRGGDDSLEGGDGNDVLIGNGGVDAYVGGNGTDRVQYQDITASLRADLLNPSTNTGEAAGETFNSIEDLLGSQSDDTILGDDNANDLFGYYGDDIIFGRGGSDILRGNDGADKLNGGAGDDIMLGGADIDTFCFDGTGFGMDRIIDFDIASETIDLTAYVGLTFGDLTIADVGGRALISFAFGEIVLTGIVAADVTSGIFDFAA